MWNNRHGTSGTAFLGAIRHASSLVFVALLAAGAAPAMAEGFPNGQYTFTTLASPNGLYPANYFTFHVDISYENTDYFAEWVTNNFAPFAAEWYPRLAEAMGPIPAGSPGHVTSISFALKASGNPATTMADNLFCGSYKFSVNTIRSHYAVSDFAGMMIHEFTHGLQQRQSAYGAGTNDAIADFVRYAWFEGKDLGGFYSSGVSVKGRGWVYDAQHGYKNCGFFEGLRERYIAEHQGEQDEWKFMTLFFNALRTPGGSDKFCTETFGLSADALREMWKQDYYLTGVENPSVLSGSDAVAMTHNHVLDLGGETKMFCGSLKGNGEPILISGTIVRNGTMEVFPLEIEYGWWSQVNSTYTIGSGASFIVKERTDQGGQMNLQGGAKLVVDGGYVEVNNNRGNGNGEHGHYVGCDSATTAQIDVRNGGRFKSSRLFMRLGENGNATGIVSVTNGTFEVSEGDIRVAPTGNGTGRLLADASRIVATSISLGRSSAGGLAEVDVRNSTLETDSICVNKAPRSGSRVKLDGVTIITGSEGEVFKGFTSALPLQVGTGGVTVSNFYDTASAVVMTGGKSNTAVLTKRGSGTFAFGGDITGLSGDIVLQEGTIAFRPGFRAASGKKVTASAGTAVALTIDANRKASTTNIVLAAAKSSDTVAIVVEELASVPINTEITVFKSLASGTSVGQLAVPSNYKASVKSDGRVVLKRVQRQSDSTPPRAFTDVFWKGAPGQSWNTDDAWQLLNGEANYYLDGDRVHFETADFSSIVSADSEPAAMLFTQSGTVGGSGRLSVPAIDVSASATATVNAPVVTDLIKTGDGALELGSFTGGKALDIEAGTVRLASGGVENPLSTAKNKVVVKGVLDLGGASQTLYNTMDSGGAGFLQNGGEIRNGTFTVTPIGYLRMPGVTFTVGAGADLVISQASGSNGRLGLRDNARLNIAGGSVTACNAGAYGYVGCDTASLGEIRITDGGSFSQTVSAMRVGWNGDSETCVTGVVSVANGSFSLPDAKDLSLASGLNAVAAVAVTNGTLDAGRVLLCETEAGGHVEFTMKNSTAHIRGFVAENQPADDSFFVFDGATLVVDGENNNFLDQVVQSITIANGGLVVTNSQDVTISAEFAGTGPLTKAGAGTMTLETSRSNWTSVLGGKLRLAQDATINGDKMTLGDADSAVPVALDLGGTAIGGNPGGYLRKGTDVTLLNGTFGNGGANVGFTEANSPASITIGPGAVVSNSQFTVNINDGGTHRINIDGGALVNTRNGNHWLMQNSVDGRLDISVANGGLLEFANETYVLTCRDGSGHQSPNLRISVNDSTVRVGGGKSLRLGFDGSNKNAVAPVCAVAATNSVFDVGYAIYVGNNAVGANTAGSYTMDFENCVVTARQISVSHDRPANAVRFNGTTVVFNGDGSSSLEAHSGFETQGGEWAGRTPLSVGPAGLTLDTQTFNTSLKADLFGLGTVTKKGAGMLNVVHAQSSSGDFVCDGGETYLRDGLAMARTVRVKDGAKFTVNGGYTSSVGGIDLHEDGAELRIDSHDPAVTPIALSGALSLPASGKARLTRYRGGDENFPVGFTPILSKSGLAASVATDATAHLEPTVAEGNSYRFMVQNNTLYLVVTGADAEYIWIGGASGSFSVASNWLCGRVPGEGAAIYIGNATSAAALVNDIADFAPASITILPGSASVTIGGSAFSGVGAVTNQSAAELVFTVPVTFSGAIDKSGDGIVRFNGGAYGSRPANHTVFYGDYHLSSTEEWVLSASITLAGNSTFDAPGLIVRPQANKINSGVGSVMTVKEVHPNSGNSDMFGTFAGRLVADRVYPEGAGAGTIGSGFTGEMRVRELRYYSGSNARVLTVAPGATATIALGGAGVLAQRGTINLSGQTLGSCADWSFDIINNGYSGSAGIISLGDGGITVDTSDLDDPSSPGHTVTVKDSATKAHDLLVGDGEFRATGSGKVVFANSAKFTGGLVASNGVTLALSSGALPGAGDVAMAKGTTLEVPFAADTGAIVAGAFNVADGAGDKVFVRVGALSDRAVCGSIKVLTVQGGFADGVTAADFALANPTASGAAATFRIVAGESGDELWLDAGEGYVWIGAGSNKLMSNPANWLGGVAPTEGGETLYFGGESETTVLSDIDDFSPSNIVFAAGSAKFTIGGKNGMKPVSGVASVVCGADAELEFAVPVYFAEAIDKSGDGIVRFNGGAHGTVPVNHSKFYGTYNLTAETWNVSSAVTLATNAVVNAPATDLRETNASTEGVLCAEAGSRLVIAQLTHTTNKGDMFGKFAGEIEVGKVVLDYVNWYRISEDFTGRMKVGYVYFHSANTDYMRFFSNGEFVVGRDGSDGSGFMARRGTFSLRETEADRPLVLRSAADWKFVSEKPGAGTGNGFCIASQGVEIDTTDWGDGATPRTVSVERSSSPAHVMTGPGYVSCFGNGKLWFKTSCEFTGGLTASNGVTLALSTGALPGAGDVAMAKGTTLEVPFAADTGAIVAGAFNVADGAGDKVFVCIGALAGRAVCGSIKVLTVQGGFADGVTAADFALANPTASGAAATFRIVAGESGDELWLDAGAGYVWTGAGANKLMSNPANWLGGVAPTEGGETLYFGGESETTVLSDIDDFSPSNIVFEAGSAKFTIGGKNGMKQAAGLYCIENRTSGVHHVFNIPVSFADGEAAEITLAEDFYMSFAGGLSAATVATPQDAVYDGSFTLLTADPFTFGNSAVVTNGTFTVANYANTSKDTLLVAKSGTLRCETATVAGTGELYLLRGLYGTFQATEQIVANCSSTFRFVSNGNGGHEVTSDGVLAAKSLVTGSANSGKVKYLAPNIKYVVGGDGIGGSKWQPWKQNWSPVFSPSSDYAISATLTCYNDSTQTNVLTFATTDFFDETAAHAVTIVQGGSVAGGDLAVAVTGAGVFAVEGGTLNAQKGVAVADIATLRFGPGASTGSGEVYVSSGATLELVSTAGASYANLVRAEAGATVAFAVAEDGLLGNLAHLSLPESGKVKVSLSCVPSSAGVVYTLVSEGSFTTADLSRFEFQADPAVLFAIPADGVLTATIPSVEYVWGDGASGADWRAAGKWDNGGVSATWLDGNAATFAADGDSATVATPVSAAMVAFDANATVNGTAALTVPEISVASGKTASVSAPTAGALTKTGAGVLQLASSRTEQTTVSEGMLAMADGATLDPAKLKLGKAGGAAALDYAGQTLSVASQNYLVSGSDVTLLNGTYNVTAGFDGGDGNLPATLTIGHDAVFSTDDRFKFNTETERTINVRGGSVVSKAVDNNWVMQSSQSGRLDINVTDGGLLEFGGETYMLTCRDGSDAYQSPELRVSASDSTVRVGGGKSLRLGRDGNTKQSATPVFSLNATNSVFDVGYGIYLGNDKAGLAAEGSFTADFDGCVITAREFRVYSDRAKNHATLNDTRIVFNANNGVVFEPVGDARWITVGADGLTLDTNGQNARLEADPLGGALTKVGAGTLTIVRDQTASSALSVEAGTLAVNASLAVARPVAVADGATLSVSGVNTLSGGLTLAGGATLALPADASGAAAPLSAASLAKSGTGAAVIRIGDGGALAPGVYALVSAGTMSASAGDFALSNAVESGYGAAFSVEGGTLVLTVSVQWPEGWNGGVVPDAEIVSRFQAWKNAFNVSDFTGNAESAFLLGVATADFEPLAVTSIVQTSGGVVTIGVNADLSAANGRVYVLTSETLEAAPEAWEKVGAATDDTGRTLVNIDGTDPARFFRVGVGY